MSKKSTLIANLKTLFSFIWGQVTPALRHKIQSLNSFAQVNADCNSILLITMLRTLMFNENEFEYKHSGFYKTMKRLYNLKQERHTSNAGFLEKFQNMLEVVRVVVKGLGNEPGLVKASLNSICFGVNEVIGATPIQLEELIRDERDRYAAIAYLISLDRNRYSNLLEDLANQNEQGFEDVYPKNLVDTYRLLTHYHIDPKNFTRLINGAHFDGISFFTDDKL